MDTSRLLLECENINDLSISKVHSKLRKFNFCLIRGLIHPEGLASGLINLKKFIEDNEDRPCTGETPSEVRDYFMKLSIGLGNHSGHDINRGRFMRTIYLPINQSDKFGLIQSFRTVAQVRNLLMNKDVNFAIDSPEDDLWTAARVHHFPTGGGFMVAHKDTLAPSLLKDKENDYSYFQPILIMSQKGVDFDKGGGTAMIDGKFEEYENFAELGDIAVYDVNTIHGVNEVDLHKPFRQRSSGGRYSGLVTLYKEQCE